MTGDARDNILRRIRDNLALAKSSTAVSDRSLPSFEMERSARRSGDVGMTLVDMFEKELVLVGGNVRKVFSKEGLYDSLLSICQKENYHKIVLSRETFVEELGLEEQLRTLPSPMTVSKVIGEDLIGQLKSADVGITACEFLVAETGTIALKSSPVAPRTLSLLPRAHVVIAREEQLFPTLAARLEALQSASTNLTSSSCITLVTGQSRTADIEKVLVKGVHGPKELYVLLMVTVK